MLKSFPNTHSFIKKLLFTILFVCGFSLLKAQDNSVSIGSAEVKANAVLWLNGNGAQGLLLPTVTNTGNISAPDPGMIVYQTSDHKIYYRNESIWVELGASSGGGGTDQTLSYDATSGELTISGTGNTVSLTAGGDLTGALSDLQLSTGSIELADLSSMGASADQMLVFNGSTWEVRAIPSGTFSGVITDNTTITGDGLNTTLSVDGSQITNIDYNNISSNLPTIPTNINDLGDILITSPSNGQILKFNGTNWINDTDDSGGTPDADEITITATGGTGAQLEVIDGSITTAKIANNAIGTSEIADDTITDADINLNAAINVTKLAGGTAGQILGTDGGGTPVWQVAGAAALPNTGDGEILIGNGSAVNSIITSGDASINNGGVITISNDAVGSAEIVNGSIVNADINDVAASKASVTAIANLTATNVQGALAELQGDIDGAVSLPATTNGQILVDNGTSLQGRTVSGDATINNTGVITIASNAIGSAEITDGSITTADINNEAINSGKIADGTIVNADINDVAASKASVTAITNLSATDVQSALAELQGDIDGAIALPATTNGQVLVNNGTSLQGRTLSGDVTIDNTGMATIASNAVNNAKIVDNSISGTKLQNNSIDTQHISANAVDGTKIASNAVGTTEITDNAVTTGKISDGTITNVDINDVAASKASVSAITNLTATNVQAALAEHQTDIDAFVDTDAQNLTLSGATGSAATGEIFNVDIDNGTGVTITEGTNIAITRTGANLTIGSTAAAAGEANTASNIGAGVGVFDSKSGADLQFNSINTASPGVINIIDDSGNSEVDIAIDQTALTIANSQVSGLGTMSTQDASSVAISNGTIDGVTLTNTNIDNTVAGNGSSLTNITAEQLQGTAINPTITPAMDDVLKWNGSQWTAQPDVAAGSPNTFTGAGNPGIVPDPSTETGRFLSDNGTWTTPPGGGDMLSGNNLNDVADVTTARNNLGLGDLALQDASTVSITGGTITGIALTNTTIDNTVTGDGSMLTGISSTVTTDGATILGDGSGGTPLNIPIGGVTTTQIFDGTVSSTDIANNTIVNADIAPGAAIDVSKIAGLIDNDASNEIQNLANVLANGNNASAPITGLTNPTNPQDAATKNYIDNLAATNNISGSFASGFTLGADVVESSHILDGAILPSDINSPGNDMVLTSDAGGTVLWEDKSNLSLISSASNGLTITGSNLTLGGAMTQPTIFTGGGDDIYFNDFNEFIVEASLFELSDPGGDLILSKSGLTFQIGNNSGTVDFQYRDGNQADGLVLTSDATGIASWEVPASSPWTLNAPNISYIAGNVGIGTAIPSNPLSVVGSDAAVSSSGVFAKIQNAVNGTDAVASGLMLGVYNSATTGAKGGVFFRRSGTFGRGDLLFSSNNIASTSSVDASDPYVKMIIESGGNVGIGNTNPNALLSLGDLYTTPVGDRSVYMSQDGGDTFYETASGDMSEGLVMHGSGIGESGIVKNIASSGFMAGKAVGLHIFNDLAESIILSTSDTERMRILGNGNVGINSSNPTNLFEVREALNQDLVIYANGRNVALGDVSGGGAGASLFIDGDGAGNFQFTGGNVGIGTTNPTELLQVNGNVGISGNGQILSIGATTASTPRIAYGYNSDASGGYGSIAVGYSAIASGVVSVALGQSVSATENGAVAIGRSNNATGSNALVLGQGNTAAAVNSTALGENMTLNSTATNSMGIGLSNALNTITAPNVMAIMGGNVGIGVVNPSTRLEVASGEDVNFGDDSPQGNFNVGGDGNGTQGVMVVNRIGSDGNLIRFRTSGTTTGIISVVGGTVTYGPFTGSHFAWSQEHFSKGTLVSYTGINKNMEDNIDSEIMYGITKTSVANSPTVLGSYLGVLEPSIDHSTDNPYLIMAVGNGDLWVIDNGKDLNPGDYLISSGVSGHAMLDDETHDLSYIIARVAEPVDWSSVSETINGQKHKLISVTFENIVINHKANRLEQDLNNLRVEVAEIKAMLGMKAKKE